MREFYQDLLGKTVITGFAGKAVIVAVDKEYGSLRIWFKTPDGRVYYQDLEGSVITN